MQIEVILLVTLFILFLSLSILFFLGKGTKWIAGYNSMTEDDKQGYDARKLGFVEGGISGGIAVLFLMASLKGDFPDIFGLYIVILVMVGILLMNTVCKAKRK